MKLRNLSAVALAKQYRRATAKRRHAQFLYGRSTDESTKNTCNILASACDTMCDDIEAEINRRLDPNKT